MKQWVKRLLKKSLYLEKKRQIINGRMVSARRIDGEIKKFLTISKRSIIKKKIIDDTIVSLTSFPERIESVKYTIFSLLQQSIQPQKIVLWLTEEEFPHTYDSVPDILKEFERYGVEVRFAKKNYRAFNKLIYSLEEFSEYNIVTADDDIYYNDKWLENLYNTHCKNPEEIIAHRVHPISFKDKKLDLYNNWKGYKKDSSNLNFLTGVGGVLYPPYSLYEDATKGEIFTKLCPYADDIWFYVMAILNKRKIRTVGSPERSILYIDSLYENENSLMNINVTQNMNDVQLKNVLEYYGIYDNFYELYAEND